MKPLTLITLALIGMVGVIIILLTGCGSINPAKYSGDVSQVRIKDK